jgi:hypothetical protein
VSFIAERLYDKDQLVGLCAAKALQQVTGEDLHLGIHEGGLNPA